MDTAFLVLTNRCPRACPFCFYRTGYLDHPAAEMTTDEVRRALGKAKELGASSVILTGGEPLIRKDFPDILNAAGRLGLRRILLTGGGLLDESALGGFLRDQLEAIGISVHSPASARELERISSALQAFPGGAITITAVFHRENFREMPALIAWVRAKGWGMILQPAFIPRGSPEYRRLSPGLMSREEWAELESALRDWAGESAGPRYPDYLRALYRGEKARPVSCAMGDRSLVIDCDGSVYPCFHRRDLKAGDILRDRASDIRAGLLRAAAVLAPAPCYGEHCVSLFVGE